MNSRRKRRVKTSMMQEQKGICFWCRQVMLVHEATFDHLIPRSRGGRNNRGNLVLAHGDCNAGRGNTIWPFGKAPPIVDQKVQG
jgi:5-methylcytosine-specific restriction endonuclease McrA